MSLVGFKAKGHPQQMRFLAGNQDVDDRALPAGDFSALHARFHFSIDVAASARNAKLPRFWTHEDNALLQSWAGETVYCNPPYSDIRPWVEKAWHEPLALCVVMLLPANRTEQGWWQDLVEPRRDRAPADNQFGVLTVEFLKGRQRFIHRGKTEVGPNERPPFGCCLLIWRWGNAGR